MRKRVTRSLLAATLLLGAALCARADVMIRQRQSNRPGYEETIYLKGTSQRREVKSEYKGQTMSWAWLDNCAQHKFIWLDLINHRYTLYTGVVPASIDAAFNEAQFPPIIPSRASKGVLLETTTVTDTGERRELFGFNARHLRTHVTWAGVPDSCNTAALRMETDGWYVDLLYGIDCSPDISGASPRMLMEMPSRDCLNHYFKRKYLFQSKHTGPALGFPLNETTTFYNEHGLVSTRTQEVLALSTAALDDALFTVPPGYVRYEPEQKTAKPSLIGRALALFGKN
jgi:hypothetical protein